MRAMPTDGQNLCLSCGLCCDGTLFARTWVGAAEPVEAFRAVGLRITPDRETEGRYELPLPCSRFENGRCRTYGCRPAICSAYRCHSLRRVEAGKMALHEAKGIVQSARARRLHLRRLLDGHFPELAGEPSMRAIRIVGRAMAGMDESRRRRFREVHGEFLLAAVSLVDFLLRYFHSPGSSDARRMNDLLQLLRGAERPPVVEPRSGLFRWRKRSGGAAEGKRSQSFPIRR